VWVVITHNTLTPVERRNVGSRVWVGKLRPAMVRATPATAVDTAQATTAGGTSVSIGGWVGRGGPAMVRIGNGEIGCCGSGGTVLLKAGRRVAG
jgi:hypothetical protein